MGKNTRNCYSVGLSSKQLCEESLMTSWNTELFLISGCRKFKGSKLTYTELLTRYREKSNGNMASVGDSGEPFNREKFIETLLDLLITGDET
ncbi:hypothetical protein ElyMa_000158500 [Elysia marginata]|uniref:Uncharacterized protein n=1 Tax=Elysia marginata TaxID=1093978 RepID=A0AAV4ES97_9GAST|nr:hypothetical protein ElyMa_000158500 [Elysia marginata]